MALGFGVLGLAPAVFWAMSPREFEAAVAGRCGVGARLATPPAKRELADMMHRFPD